MWLSSAVSCAEKARVVHIAKRGGIYHDGQSDVEEVAKAMGLYNSN